MFEDSSARSGNLDSITLDGPPKQLSDGSPPETSIVIGSTTKVDARILVDDHADSPRKHLCSAHPGGRAQLPIVPVTGHNTQDKVVTVQLWTPSTKRGGLRGPGSLSSGIPSIRHHIVFSSSFRPLRVFPSAADPPSYAEKLIVLAPHVSVQAVLSKVNIHNYRALHKKGCTEERTPKQETPVVLLAAVSHWVPLLSHLQPWAGESAKTAPNRNRRHEFSNLNERLPVRGPVGSTPSCHFLLVDGLLRFLPAGSAGPVSFFSSGAKTSAATTNGDSHEARNSI